MTREPAAVRTPAPSPYASGLEHLADELRVLDADLLRAVASADGRTPGLDGHQGLYVTQEEVELLLAPTGSTADAAGADHRVVDGAEAARLRDVVDARVAASREAGLLLPLPHLAARLGLSDAEQRALVVCLAPELDRKYDRVYAYLQDDLTRQRPSVDLVVALLAETRETREERWRALRLLSPHAPLRHSGAVRVVEDHESPSGSTALSQLLRLDPLVVAHLLGDSQLDPTLAGIARHVVPRPGPATALVHRLRRLVDHHLRAGLDGLLVHLSGTGGEPVDIARALVAALDASVIEVDGDALPSRPDEMADAVGAALRNGWLLGVPVLLGAADRVLRPTDGWTRTQLLDGVLRRFPGLVLAVGEQPWPGPPPAGSTLHEVRLERPDASARVAAWDAALSGEDPQGDLRLAPVPGPGDPGWARRLADQFRLDVRQISAAAEEARRTAVAEDRPVELDDYVVACRRRSSRALDGLAQRVPTVRGWDDLVLEPERMAVLREVCAQVRLRDTVLDTWGLGRRTGASRGLSVLFTGPPGTGKSMGAGIVARDLGLDLYRIDLSQVVSKYIGETEKNLSRVFAAAEDSGAVLLFDEADALFGARTEISDAHDRYANIETSYLLQRMEEYDGIAVLSTNLRDNMDEAFLRRLRFVVEFPFPATAERRRIWEGHLRGEAPLADDVDLDALAARLPVAGGSIRNIVLAAAFLAADDGGRIGMDHLARAARREFDKLGKLWREGTDPGAPARRAR